MITFISLILFIFLPNEEGILSIQKYSSVNVMNTFKDENYYYFLENMEIDEIINSGIHSLRTLDDFILPMDQSREMKNISFAYIQTPELIVNKQAKKTYFKFGRRIHAAEAKEALMDQYLSFGVRFNENNGMLHEIIFLQNNKAVKPAYKEIKGSGGLIIVSFKTNDIDFNEEAQIKIIDQTESSEKAVFYIDFSLYSP